MDDRELASLLAAHESKAIGYFDSEIAAEQARRSIIITARWTICRRSTAAPAWWTIPSRSMSTTRLPRCSSRSYRLTRLFHSPRGPEDEEQAKQATEYVNYVITCDNPGFQIFHDWFKDGLLTKLGVVKAWWEDQTSYGEQKHAMDPQQLLEARQHEDYE
jgi:hypothetical protein